MEAGGATHETIGEAGLQLRPEDEVTEGLGPDALLTLDAALRVALASAVGPWMVILPVNGVLSGWLFVQGFSGLLMGHGPLGLGGPACGDRAAEEGEEQGPGPGGARFAPIEVESSWQALAFGPPASGSPRASGRAPRWRRSCSRSRLPSPDGSPDARAENSAGSPAGSRQGSERWSGRLGPRTHPRR